MLLTSVNNPFDGEPEIRFHIPDVLHTQVVLVNMQGQTDQVLIDQVIPKGNHLVRLQAGGLSKGNYYYRLTAGQDVATKKLIIK